MWRNKNCDNIVNTEVSKLINCDNTVNTEVSKSIAFVLSNYNSTVGRIFYLKIWGWRKSLAFINLIHFLLLSRGNDL